MFSQNQEEDVILSYFKDKPVGQLLDVGANDGVTFSNSRALILSDWAGDLVEPDPVAFKQLTETYNPNVKYEPRCFNCAISNTTGKFRFYSANDSLYSTVLASNRRHNPAFDELDVMHFKYSDFLLLAQKPSYDFITIDAEGLDLQILEQIDLSKTKLVCVEHNGTVLKECNMLLNVAGFTTLLINAENIIGARL